MLYNNNYLNQANQNTVGQNALKDTQLGTVNMSFSDVAETSADVIKCQLLNNTYGSSNGDLTDNSESTNPVKTEYADAQYQKELQIPTATRAYPPRTNQGSDSL